VVSRLDRAVAALRASERQTGTHTYVYSPDALLAALKALRGGSFVRFAYKDQEATYPVFELRGLLELYRPGEVHSVIVHADVFALVVLAGVPGTMRRSRYTFQCVRTYKYRLGDYFLSNVSALTQTRKGKTFDLRVP
jgi:hypothetical protein